MNRFFGAAATLAFLTGLVLEMTGFVLKWRKVEITPISDPMLTLQENAIRLPMVGEELTVDISESLDVLWALPEEERPHQIADWAVLATLNYAGIDAAGLRDATWDVPPARLPELQEAYSFGYRPARHSITPAGTVLVFRRADDPTPAASVAQEVDQATLDHGERLERFVELTFDESIADGALVIQRVRDLSAAEVFGPEFGYVEHDVRSVADLERALAAIDTLSGVWRNGEGLVVAGRRLEEHRTPGVTLDDVAALYRAQRELGRAGREWESRANGVGRRHLDRFNALVDRLKRGVAGYDDVAELAREYDVSVEVAAVGGRLGGLGGLLPWAPSEEPSMPSGSRRERLKSLLEPLRLRVESQAQQDLRRWLVDNPRAPSEPGFSLDPQWDDEELRRDLRLILSSPDAFLLSARADASSSLPPDRSTARVEVARDLTGGLSTGDFRALRELRAYGIQSFQLTSAERAALRSVLEHLDDPQRRDLAYLEIERILDDARITRTGGLLPALLEVARARDRVQCARYDGPLQGTQVGMTLFYTDLLAKLWASVDYGRSAPTDAVPGFVSQPRDGPNVEAEWLDEIRRLPSTRLWFAPDESSLLRTEDGLLFAPVVARVYAAGSNPVHPEAESEAAEPSRRALGWWDRHYATVADHEPEYHRQNEILKWSVVTGWLASQFDELGADWITTQRTLRDLDYLRVDRSHRFDRWYEQNRNRLRYSGSLPLLPESDWVGETECLELLSSYSFQTGRGGWRGRITGGVSLGSSASLATRNLSGMRGAWSAVGNARRGAIRLGSELEPTGFATRTGRVALSAERGVARTTLDGFEGSVQFRAGGAQHAIRRLETSVQGGGGVANIRLGSNLGEVASARLAPVGAHGAALRVELGSFAAQARPLAPAIAAETLAPSAALRSLAQGSTDALQATVSGASAADDALGRVLAALRRGDATVVAAELAAGSAPTAGIVGPNGRALVAVAAGEAAPLARGHRVLTLTSGRATGRATQLTDAATRTPVLEAVRRGEAVVFVQDGALAGALAPELSPAAALTHASRRGTLVLEEVTVAPVGAGVTQVMPDALQVAGGTYLRLGGASAGARTAYVLRCRDERGDVADCP